MNIEKEIGKKTFYDGISLLVLNEKAFKIGLIDQNTKDRITNEILSKEKI